MLRAVPPPSSCPCSNGQAVLGCVIETLVEVIGVVIEIVSAHDPHRARRKPKSDSRVCNTKNQVAGTACRRTPLEQRIREFHQVDIISPPYFSK
jgi:hypothetical protein